MPGSVRASLFPRTGDGSWGRLDTKPQALLTPCCPWRQQCPSPREDAVALRSYTLIPPVETHPSCRHSRWRANRSSRLLAQSCGFYVHPTPLPSPAPHAHFLPPFSSGSGRAPGPFPGARGPCPQPALFVVEGRRCPVNTTSVSPIPSANSPLSAPGHPILPPIQVHWRAYLHLVHSPIILHMGM